MATLSVERLAVPTPFLGVNMSNAVHPRRKGIRIIELKHYGKIHLTAPLGRIHHRIRRMAPPGPYSPDANMPKLTVAALRQKEENHIITVIDTNV